MLIDISRVDLGRGVRRDKIKLWGGVARRQAQRSLGLPRAASLTIDLCKAYSNIYGFKLKSTKEARSRTLFISPVACGPDPGSRMRIADVPAGGRLVLAGGGMCAAVVRDPSPARPARNSRPRPRRAKENYSGLPAS